MSQLWLALWFFLPAGLANFAPVIAARIVWLRHCNAPMDFGKTFRGRAILGSSKTWRGLISGVIVGAATGAITYLVYPASIDKLKIVTSAPVFTMLLLGALLGLGALAGDAAASFFKRQLNILPGHSWFPFDQIDYILGGILLSLLIIRLSFVQYSLILITWFCIHVVSVYIGYKIGLRDKPI